MPFIETKVNVPIPPEKENILKKRFAKIIELFPGKSENWLMLNFCDNCRLWFKGDNSGSLAYVEVKILGSIDASASEKATAQICSALEEILDIPPSGTYVKYESADLWGWNGGNF